MAVTPKIADVRLIKRGRTIVALGRMQIVREACELNRMELGRMIGVRPGTIANWENDKRVPHAEHAITIAKVIDKLGRIAAQQEEFADTG